MKRYSKFVLLAISILFSQVSFAQAISEAVVHSHATALGFDQASTTSLSNTFPNSETSLHRLAEHNSSGGIMIRLGDVTGNDTIDQADIDALGEYIVGRVPEGFVLEAADFNQDGRISVLDVMQINEYLLSGKEDEFFIKRALLQLYEAIDGERTLGNIGWSMDVPFDNWQSILQENDEIPRRFGFTLYLLLQDSVYFPKDLPVAPGLTGININGIYGRNISGKDSKTDGYLMEYLSNYTDLERLIMTNVRCGYSFPEEIRGLSKLRELDFNEVDLHDTIPDWLYDLTELEYLGIRETSMGGQISPKIAQLTKLKKLLLDNVRMRTGFEGEILPYICNLPLENIDLRGNNFSGTLPCEFVNLMDRADTADIYIGAQMQLGDNQFGGMIPSCIYQHPMWKYLWGKMIDGSTFMNTSIEIIPAPDYNLIDMNGVIHSSTDYSSHKLTLICQWDDCADLNEYLTHWYDQYGDKGLEIIGYASGVADEWLTNIIEEQHIQWPVIKSTSQNRIDGYGLTYPTNTFPSIEIIDSTGNMVYASSLQPYISIDDIENILARYCQDPSEVDYYQSTDYSQDGRVDTLQLASEGNGINIVLMGDGFSDRQIANGTYRQYMERAVEAFFLEEPYHTYRNLFNVYMVNVVSHAEGYAHGGQRLGTGFGYDTEVFGNDAACIYYANKAVSEDKMDDLGIIVLMDSAYYAGTCYMYYPTRKTDYGSGLSISYFPLGVDSIMFNGIVQHEAGGHGFGKLADEYSYDYMGEISEAAISQTRQVMDYHWYDNVDFTSDSMLVKWSRFLSDSRYDSLGLGCYEGGLTYASGVWRPSETSIMRYNTDGFNAPSREAIWSRIHKLAYGSEWQYNYEDFVTYDSINRISSSISHPQRARRMIQGNFVPLQAPVIRTENWRDLLKEKTPKIQVTSRTIMQHHVSLEQIASQQAQLRNIQIQQHAANSIYADDIIIQKSADSLCMLQLRSNLYPDAMQFDLTLPTGVSYCLESVDSINIAMELSATMAENASFIKTGFVSDSCVRILCANLQNSNSLSNYYGEKLLNIPLNISENFSDSSVIRILNSEQICYRDVYLCDEYDVLCHFLPTSTITFVNYDGSILQSSEVNHGDTPVYTGAVPTKPATAQYTYTFKGWDKEIVSVVGAETYTAQYDSVVNQYTITVTGENCTITGDGTYDYGTEVTLTVTPDEGYRFTEWSDGVPEAIRQIIVVEDATYIAHTEKQSVSTGQQENSLSEQVQKIFDGTNYYILRGGKRYTMQGAEVK